MGRAGSTSTSDPLALAEAWIGTPYTHGQAMRGAGCDCLGLVRGVFAEITGQMPPVPTYPQVFPGAAAVARQMADACDAWLRARPERPMPGDVVQIAMRRTRPATHLAIYAGGGEIIHAYSGHVTRRDRIHPAWSMQRAWRFPQSCRG